MPFLPPAVETATDDKRPPVIRMDGNGLRRAGGNLIHQGAESDRESDSPAEGILCCRRPEWAAIALGLWTSLEHARTAPTRLQLCALAAAASAGIWPSSIMLAVDQPAMLLTKVNAFGMTLPAWSITVVVWN